jgi:hypothetical protein
VLQEFGDLEITSTSSELRPPDGAERRDRAQFATVTVPREAVAFVVERTSVAGLRGAGAGLHHPLWPVHQLS